MAFPTVDQLTAYLEPLAQECGVDIEGIKLNKAGKKSQVTILIDSGQGIHLDQLEEMSIKISSLFDAAEEAGELNFGLGYRLEVSTPGIDLPLTLPRHWQRNRGRVVNVPEKAGEDAGRWRVGAISPSEDEVVLVRGGKRGTVGEVRCAQLENIAGAVVDIEFVQPPAAELAVTELAYEEARNQWEDHK